MKNLRYLLGSPPRWARDKWPELLRSDAASVTPFERDCRELAACAPDDLDRLRADADVMWGALVGADARNDMSNCCADTPSSS